MQDFRKLKVWHRAHAFSVQIRACARAISQPGNTEFKTQLTRAADSIANNIVEGCAAATRKEFARYLDISIKSTSEVDYQLESARDNDLLQRRTCRLLMME